MSFAVKKKKRCLLIHYAVILVHVLWKILSSKLMLFRINCVINEELYNSHVFEISICVPGLVLIAWLNCHNPWLLVLRKVFLPPPKKPMQLTINYLWKSVIKHCLLRCLALSYMALTDNSCSLR